MFDSLLNWAANFFQVPEPGAAFTVAVVALAIAFLGDGLECIYKAVRFKRSQRILKELRNDLRQLARDRKVDNPRFGFVMPCYHNEEELSNCLNSLIYDADIAPSDIVVVDDDVSGNKRMIEKAKRYGVQTIKLVQHERDVRKLSAQLKGVERMRELGKEYIVACDSDVFIKANRSEIALAIQEMKVFDLDAMAVRVLPKTRIGMGLLERIQLQEYKFSMGIGRGGAYAVRFRNKLQPVGIFADLHSKYSLSASDVLCVSGAFGIFKTELLYTVLKERTLYGGGEDFEITMRALARNAKIGYHDDLTVETAVPATIGGITRQRYFWAQFLTSPLAGADYMRRFRKSHKTSAKTFYTIMAIRDHLGHPVKLASFFFLFMSRLGLIVPVTWLLFYLALALFQSLVTRTRGDRRTFWGNVFLPLFSFYNLVVPHTFGYFKQLGRALRFRKRKEVTEKRKIELALYENMSGTMFAEGEKIIGTRDILTDDERKIRAREYLKTVDGELDAIKKLEYLYVYSGFNPFKELSLPPLIKLYRAKLQEIKTLLASVAGKGGDD